jgi:hypothetical protein
LENRLEFIEKEILESEKEKHKLKSECLKMSKKIEKIKSINTVLETHRTKQNSNFQNTEKEMLKMLLQYVGSNEFMDNNG